LGNKRSVYETSATEDRTGPHDDHITRCKKGFDKLLPKYICYLIEGVHSGKFFMAGKKRPANATSNYIISTDSKKWEKTHLPPRQGEVKFSWHRIFYF
jgi:hypothetical protein